MKNLYLFLILILLNAVSVHSQNQNKHWFFGDLGGLRFDNDPPTPLAPLPATGMTNPAAGNATVSDQAGNLLFYTNGMSVWNSNHVVMTNGTGLLGDSFTTQTVVIVPNPADINKYYVVTLSCHQSAHLGLHYSEVDMTNPLGEVILATKNTVMKDQNGTAINASYTNFSGKLTTALHSNGQDYWVVAQIGSNVLSYRVDNTGITFEQSSPAPVTQLDFDYVGSGPIKISADGSKALIVYTRGDNQTSTLGRLYFGDFDPATGLTSNFQLLPLPAGFIGDIGGAEFSPVNNFIYYSTEDDLLAADVTDPNNIKHEILTNGLSVTWDIQRAMNGKLYLADLMGYNDTGQLGVINFPDVFGVAGCGLAHDSVFLNGSGDSSGLPAWVNFHAIPEGECPPNLTLTAPVTSPTPVNVRHRQANHWIVANNIINPGTDTNTIYHANDYVELIPGFETIIQAEFAAYIADCDTGYPYRPPGKDDTAQVENPVAQANGIKIYPNPSDGMITVSCQTAMRHVNCATVDGKIMFSQNIESNLYQIDVSGFAKGIYIISVQTADGKPINSKFIKN